MPEIFFLIFATILGAAVGSFLNVVILRLPEENNSIAFPASHCPKCLSPLHWYENIPILSYLLLRGRCSHCKGKISLQYPLVEAAMAALSAALFYQSGLSIHFIGYFIFTAALLAIIFIDYQHYIIPDAIDLPGIILGFLFSFVNPLVSWQSSLIGIVAGGGILWAVAVIYSFLRKKEGMGGGDIKLLAMLGAWLGWQSLPFIIFFSSFSGAVIGSISLYLLKKDQASQIPFGPFLSVAAFLFLFFNKQISSLYQLYLNGQWL